MADELKLGDVLRTKREELREQSPEYTLRSLAQKVGVSPAYLCLVEKGEVAPKPDCLRKLADELQLDADMLFNLAGQMNPDLAPILKQPGIPAFLRTLDGLSQEQLIKISAIAQYVMSQEKGNG